MKVELVTKTVWLGQNEVSLDEMIVAQARVSSPKTGEEIFEKPEKLIRYLIQEGHWSPFDMANLGFEIETSRAMGRELLRHWSIHPNINPQEYSQRYSPVLEYEPVELRLQAKNNRQSSTLVNEVFDDLVEEHLSNNKRLYELLLDNGIARETARFVLPETAKTRLYMNGTIRSWITFLNVRLHKTSQKEMRQLALEVANIFTKELPITAKALFDFENAYDVHFLDRLVLEKYNQLNINN